MTSVAEKAYERFPDDTQVAYVFVSCCVDDGCPDRSQLAVPLLVNAMWACPYACLAVARLCGFRHEFDDAFACLNAACYARQFQSCAAPTLAPPDAGLLHSADAAGPRPGPAEEEAVASQLTGLAYLLHRGASELARKITPARFKMLLSQRFRTTEDVDQLLARAAVAPAAGAPSDRELELEMLFDPGLCAPPATAVPPYVRELPLCKRFAEVAQAVVDGIARAENAVTARQIDGFTETRRCELLALRLEDGPLLEFVGAYVRKYKQLRAFHELLQLRFNQVKVWQGLVKGGEIVAKKMTVNEYNALVMFRSLADGMCEFFPA
jgi:hypothetical protein